MHDTFLNKRIVESLLKLCEENNLSRLNKVVVVVNIDSHISENSLREHLSESCSRLVGEWTEITVEKQEAGKLIAVIKSIEGESPDE